MQQFQVNAKENSLSGGSPLNTGIDVSPGDLIVVSCSPMSTWSAGKADRTSNANGLGNPLGGQFGLHSRGDYSFLFGSLVGTFDGGRTFFGVGTNLTMTVLTEGTLSFLYWDSNNGDNSGHIDVTVQVFKGPAGIEAPVVKETPQYFKLTSMFLESKNLFLEGNGGLSSQNTLGGAAFMSPQVNASGTIWKMIPLDNGYFQLTTLFMEDKNVVLEGNGGFDSSNTLGGAAFLSPQTNASGTMWKMIPLDNGYFQLTTMFMESKNVVLEGNGGFDSSNTLGGAAFLSPQTNASGTMWKMIPVEL